LDLLAFLVLAQAIIPTPTGVNGSVLGTPDQFMFKGPGTLCLSAASIELLPTETAYLGYSGIHSQKIEISGPAGRLELTESEPWGRSKGKKMLLMQRQDMKVCRIDDGTEFRYLVYGRDTYSDGKLVPKIWVDGDALRGNRKDREIVSRLFVGSPKVNECAISYNYGWGVLLEGEPLVKRKDKSLK
jgi:hypothetical protein